MIKLCWSKDFYGNVLEYFYDEKQDLVYCADLAEYNKKTYKFKFTLGVGYSCAIFSAVFGKILDGIFVGMNELIILLLAAIIVITAVLIPIAYRKSEAKKFDYIRKSIEGEKRSAEEVLKLFADGKNYRSGLTALMFICIALTVIFAFIYAAKRDLMSIIMLYTGFVGTVIWGEIFSPLQTYGLKRRLEKRVKSE